MISPPPRDAKLPSSARTAAGSSTALQPPATRPKRSPTARVPRAPRNPTDDGGVAAVSRGHASKLRLLVVSVAFTVLLLLAKQRVDTETGERSMHSLKAAHRQKQPIDAREFDAIPYTPELDSFLRPPESPLAGFVVTPRGNFPPLSDSFVPPPVDVSVPEATPSSPRPKSMSAALLQQRFERALDGARSQVHPLVRPAVGRPPTPPPERPATSVLPTVFLSNLRSATAAVIEHPPAPNNLPMFVPGVSPVRPVPNPKTAFQLPPGHPNRPADPPVKQPVAQAAMPAGAAEQPPYADLLEADPSKLLPPPDSPPFRAPSTPPPRVRPLLGDATPRDRMYSRVFCVGNRGRQGTADDTSCRFRNVCLDLTMSQWQYFQDPAEKDFPLLAMDDGRIITEFPRPLLNLRSMGLQQDAQYWTPTKIVGAIPQTSATAWPRRNDSEPDVHLLYHGHYPSNMGHLIGDDLFPLFNLMQSFRLTTNSPQLLMSRSCEEIFPRSKKAATCEKFMQIFPRGVTDRPVVAVTQQAALRQALRIPPTASLVCFENLLAGLSPFGFQQSLGRADAWHAYHDFYLSNLGLLPNHTPRKQRIVVSIKEGKRGFANTRELIQHLKQTFGSRFEIHAVELRTLGSWRNELAYLLDTSVLITPCGGVSMSAMFLPKGSAMVIVDYFSTRAQTSVGMEEKLWTNTGYIRPFHYPFHEYEVVLPAKGEWGQTFSRTNFADMRGYGMVRVDLERMTKVVKAAIDHVDNFMSMGQD